MANVVITGANRGIGLALVKQYLGRGDKVFALCRKTSAALQQTSAQVIEGIDMLDTHNLAQSLAPLKSESIDVLINNAGILRNESLGDIEQQQIQQQFTVNALAPLVVTDILRNNLTDNAKVAMITSRMGSIADNGSGGRYGYRMSKAALNAASMSLALDLQPRGIAVAILHPGYVQTEMVNMGGDISADLSASRLVERIDELKLENTGTFWHSNGQVLPW